MQYFPSERSFFFHVIAWGIMPGSLIAVALTQVWSAVFVMLVSAAFVLWIWAKTGYTLTETHLLVQSGPLRWQIPLASIRRVRPSNNPLSSPALSFQRLEVRHDKGSILISPQDRARFLAELRRRCPDAEISTM